MQRCLSIHGSGPTQPLLSGAPHDTATRIRALESLYLALAEAPGDSELVAPAMGSSLSRKLQAPQAANHKELEGFVEAEGSGRKQREVCRAVPLMPQIQETLIGKTIPAHARELRTALLWG